MTTVWAVQIDWDRDGSVDAIDSIWDDVISLTWKLGMGKPWQTVADESTCDITVKNIDGKYNPENSTSPLYGYLLPYRPVKILANGETVWVGWTESIAPEWSPAGPQTGKTRAGITCNGAKQRLQESAISLTLQEDKRGDQIIRSVLSQVVLPPATLGSWILGKPNFSELGVTTRLGNSSAYSSLDVGSLVFPYYGDRLSGENANAYSIIADLTEAERGRFFFDRSGRAVWWNRYHRMDTAINDGTVASVGDIRPINLSYQYGMGISNWIQVTAYPRKSTSSITLWTLDKTLTIPAMTQYEFEAPFVDATNQPTGASGSLSTSGVTFSAGTATITLTQRGDRALVTANNVGSIDAVLTAMNITGQALTAHNRMIVRREDSTSIRAFGRRGEIKLNLQAIEDYAEAQEIAELELRQRKDPRGEVGQVTFINAADNVANAHQLLWTIGTRLLVDLPEMGHNQAYIVMGEKHSVTKSGKRHETTFFYEPCILTRLSHYYKSHADTGVSLEYNNPEKTRLAQGFEVSASQTVSFVRLWLKKTGSPTGNLTVKIYSNHGIGGGWRLGVPGSSNLETSTLLAASTEYPDALVTNGTSDTVSAATLTSAYTWAEFTFATPPSLTAGTKYWLVLSTSDTASGSNYVQWGADASSPTYRSRFLFGRAAGVWATLNKIGCYQLLNAASDVVSQFASSYQDDHGQLNALATGGPNVIDTIGTTNLIIGDNGGNDQWGAQSFQVAFAGNLSELQIRFSTNVGSPSGKVIWQIRTDSSGSPSSTILDSGVFTPTVSSNNTITVSDGLFLAAGVTYWLLLRCRNTQSAGNSYRVSHSIVDPYSGGLLKRSINGSSWITISAGAADLRAIITVSSASTRDKLAQGVRLDGVSKIASAKLWLRKIGSPSGNLTLKIYLDNGNKPGMVLATSATVAASSLSSSYGWITFTFSSPPTLATDQLYWLQLETSDSASASSFVEWGADNGQSSYPGWMVSERGQFKKENKDAIFEVYH